ncbi:hypothetical protein AMJ85_04995 [candidate division BRC1 bacterium SM23_51]|nr:MAG: hypothetical protein AMJ85_04995 [candidate division BRC1 bacterium SM23_51]
MKRQSTKLCTWFSSSFILHRSFFAKGVTLLEVLVATAAAAILFGVAMGILLTTNQTADRSLDREWLAREAQLAMQEIRAVIEGTVWPEDLASAPSAEPPADAVVAFAKDGLALFSSHNPTSATGRFCHYSLGYKKDPAKDGAPVAGFYRRSPDEKGPPEFRPLGRKLGEDCETTIGFRYATEVGPDLKPVWQEKLEAGQKPRLIWVELVVSEREPAGRRGEPQKVRLATAIAL